MDELALAVMITAVVSLAAQHGKETAIFYVLDGTPADAPFAGMLRAIAGALRSILLAPNGPTIVQLRALSHTCRLSVNAFASSVPAGTLVESEKEASPGLARPGGTHG